ncbi:GrBNV gp36-like protein-like protein [Mauternbach virus]|uniref:GrBNV gp36-like protein-like protein n=1 Tax=Mauternbach virus TaxID=2486603 RepID=A0A3G3E7H0_9VIRU|nr:GrBNV gp36-like protein-like protein [Mauternbach virus]AYP97930.1 GrBNV gp36-like protein-like protein [Mauternbach virus]
MNYDSLLDTESVPVHEVQNHGVVISVPTLYINADEESGIDRVVPNLRVIPYQTLVKLISIAININSVSKNEVAEKCNYLVNYLIKRMDTNESASFMEFIKFSSRISKDLDIDDDYYDVTTSGISFDVIRKYINDPHTGVLQMAEPIEYLGYKFYSEIPENQNYNTTVLQIRHECNDTDFNRIQFHLAHFERTLTFTPGYVYNSTLKLKCLALFYVALYTESKPIAEHCSNDLKGNLLAYILDCVVRSRVIQAWQRDSASKKLTNDIIKNYDTRVHIIKLCQLTTSKARAQHFINLMRQNPELQKFTSHLNFDLYMGCLQKTSLKIENNTYYLLGSEFISSIAVNLPDLTSLQNIYEENHMQ